MNRRSVPLLFLAAFLSVAAVTAAQPPAGPQGRALVHGTATYRERIALPPNAVFEATLEDVSRADAPAGPVGSVLVEPAGQVPIRFEIPYDPSLIREGNSYAVRGRITVDGKPWFTTDKARPVLTRGFSAEADLTLLRFSGPSGPEASLVNTYWRIVRLGEDPVSAFPDRREPHLVLSEEGGRKSYAATIGCNRMAGGFSVDGESMRFMPGASTLMACPPPLDALERKLLEALERTRKWRIEGDTLEFIGAGGAPAARFKAGRPSPP